MAFLVSLSTDMSLSQREISVFIGYAVFFPKKEIKKEFEGILFVVFNKGFQGSKSFFFVFYLLYTFEMMCCFCFFVNSVILSGNFQSWFMSIFIVYYIL